MRLVVVGAQELATAVEQKLHIVVLLLNDSAYGMIKWKAVRLLPRASALLWLLPACLCVLHAHTDFYHHITITGSAKPKPNGHRAHTQHVCSHQLARVLLISNL